MGFFQYPNYLSAERHICPIFEISEEEMYNKSTSSYYSTAAETSSEAITNIMVTSEETSLEKDISTINSVKKPLLSEQINIGANMEMKIEKVSDRNFFFCICFFFF